MKWSAGDIIGHHPHRDTTDSRILNSAVTDPHRPAVVDGGRIISRVELDLMIGRFADRLAAEGVGSGGTVAVHLPSSADQIAATLGVLRIGATCLPLSPATPPELLRFRLADCGVAAVIADAHDPVVAMAPGATTITPYGPAPSRSARPRRRDDGDADAVAWITPAEGFAGATCGAELTHDNLAFVSDWLHAQCGVGPGERICHMSEPGTSAALLEVVGPLCLGATIIIMDDRVATDPPAFRHWLDKERIAVVFADDDALAAIADAPVAERMALRLVVTDASAVQRTPVAPGLRIMATYGHDECTMVAAARVLARNERPGGPHLGTPIPGAAIHILDDDGEPVSPGDEGNIWIAGRGVGRGYRNRPDLTAERFVPDPFGPDPAGMIFRTGRRGRRLIGGGLSRLDRAHAAAC